MALAVEVLDQDGNPAWRIVVPVAPVLMGLAFALAIIVAVVGNPIGSVSVAAIVPAEPATPAVEVARVVEPAPSLPPPNGRRVEASLRAGENLSLLFRREKLSAADLDGIVKSNPLLTKRLRSIKPGQDIVIDVSDANEVARLAWRVDVWETVEFVRNGDGYEGRELRQSPTPKRGIYAATIDHSLFVAATRAGLEDKVALELADAFRWDVDFITQVRPGDSFRVLIEELWLEGERQEFGDILAAEFTNRGAAHIALRYQGDFFDADGRPLRKSFLQAPLEFTRVSSPFNPSRVHPLWGTRRPHRGTDYAAPTGTPVYATGAGTVTKAGRTAPNGNYVVIRHSGGIETKYLHLNSIATKRGAQVRQGDLIGRVGSTGWSTGPHLHYEFVVNGVHRDPVTVDLPKPDPIPESEKEDFLRVTAPLLAALNRTDESPQLAAAFGED